MIAFEPYDPVRDPVVHLVAAERLDVPWLRLTWDDGEMRDVDLSPWLTGSALLQMVAAPEVFRDFEIVHDGGGIAWVNGVDFCAQALRQLADRQLVDRMERTA